MNIFPSGGAKGQPDISCSVLLTFKGVFVLQLSGAHRKVVYQLCAQTMFFNHIFRKLTQRPLGTLCNIKTTSPPTPPLKTNVLFLRSSSKQSSRFLTDLCWSKPDSFLRQCRVTTRWPSLLTSWLTIHCVGLLGRAPRNVTPSFSFTLEERKTKTYMKPRSWRDTALSDSCDSSQLIRAWQLHLDRQCLFSVILVEQYIIQMVHCSVLSSEDVPAALPTSWSHSVCFPRGQLPFFFPLIKWAFSFVFHLSIKHFKTQPNTCDLSLRRVVHAYATSDIWDKAV